jgi:hypothetical protein
MWVPSKSKPGNDRGDEPVAIRTFRPRTLPPSTSTLCPSLLSVPRPGTTVTLRPFSSVSSPLVSRLMTWCLRSWQVDSCIDGSPATVIPNSPAPRIVRSTSAVWSSSLAGMQPRCRHVPPRRCSSTIAMRRPADAPYSAAA